MRASSPRAAADRARAIGTALSAAIGLVLSTAACAASAAPDQALLAAARAAEPSVIESLREMVSIESGSADADGLARMADYAQARLKALGGETERARAGRGPGSIVQATFTGTGTKRFMLIAHMDTVYPAGTLAAEPFRRDGHRLYGPGIGDDKSGIAVVLHALAILRAAGWHDYARLTVLFDPDEEIGSGGSGERIAALADAHDVVLSCEPTGARDVMKEEGLVLGAAGTASVTMEVRGRASHAGGAPGSGRNALIELAFQLQQTKDVAKGIPGAQLNWTMAQAGVVSNQIPERATARADVRISAPGAAEALLAALQEKVGAAHAVPDTTTTVRMGGGRPPFQATAAARSLAATAQAIYAELDGRGLRLSEHTGGSTDAGFAGRSGKAVVLEGFGLAGANFHARGEYVDVESIVPRLYLMTRLLQTVAATN